VQYVETPQRTAKEDFTMKEKFEVGHASPGMIYDPDRF